MLITYCHFKAIFFSNVPAGGDWQYVKPPYCLNV